MTDGKRTRVVKGFSAPQSRRFFMHIISNFEEDMPFSSTNERVQLLNGVVKIFNAIHLATVCWYRCACACCKLI